jgi:hypothetical protein
LTNLGRLLGKSLRSTSAETRYVDLEPWIQWVSVHSGLAGPAHGIFRLGDIVHSSVPQFFEQLESTGLRVGAVSPMNAANRLKAPAYFVPDPWTHTPTDSSPGSRRLWEALSQVVNDNASGRLTARSAATLLQALLRHANPRHYGLYLSLGRRALKSSWCRALLLDLFLHDMHMRLYRQHRPDLSVLFLKAPIRGREIAALALSYAGIALVLVVGGRVGGANVPLGAALVFGSAVVYSVYLVAGTQERQILVGADMGEDRRAVGRGQ